MSKRVELDTLDRAIKDAELSLKSIRTKLEQIDKEIKALQPLKNQLEENIEFLKREDTIPIANEFKKVKAELSKTKTRLNMITGDHAKGHKAMLDTEEIIAKFKRDYQKLIIDSENNVLPLSRGKRGKK